MAITTPQWSTLSVFDALLKTVYKGPVIDELNSRDTVYGLIRKDEGYEGRSLVIPVLKARAESHGFFASGSQLPTSISPAWANLSITPKYFSGTLRVDKETMVQSRSDVGAFQRSFAALVERLPIDSKDTLNRVMVGTGTGRLAASTAISAGPPYTVTIADSASAAGTYPDLRKIGLNMLVDQWSSDASGAAQDAASWSVTDVAPSGNANQFVLDSVTGTSTGTPVGTASHVFTRAGARTSTTRNEAMGLSGIIAATNPPLDASGLQGISVSVAGNAYWKSYVSSAGALRPLNGPLLQVLCDGASMKGRGKISYFFVTYGIRAEYSELQQNVRRTVNTARISGDTTGGISENEDARDWLEFNHIPLVMDKYIPANTILAADMSSIFCAVYAPWDWLDDDGRVLKWVPNYASFTAILYMYGELACQQRNRNAVATQVAGDDPIIV